MAEPSNPENGDAIARIRVKPLSKLNLSYQINMLAMMIVTVNIPAKIYKSLSTNARSVFIIYLKLKYKFLNLQYKSARLSKTLEYLVTIS